jgi:hypothetical protein
LTLKQKANGTLAPSLPLFPLGFLSIVRLLPKNR